MVFSCVSCGGDGIRGGVSCLVCGGDGEIDLLDDRMSEVSYGALKALHGIVWDSLLTSVKDIEDKLDDLKDKIDEL